MERVELKNLAKKQIKGKIGILFLITLIIGLISGGASVVLSFIPVVGSVASMLVSAAFVLSLARVYIGLAAGKDPEVGDAFAGFDDFWSAFKVNILVAVFTFLWSLLFIIPGIIKGISYSMAMYILAENKGKSARECINESKAMMNGHKADFFVLGLSFIGWILLCCITCGIAFIWVGPYMSATQVNFYNAIKPAAPVVEAEAVEEVVVEEPVAEEPVAE